MEKAVYIKQLKLLIKKYHPDLCTDEHLESLYNEEDKTTSYQQYVYEMGLKML